MTANVTEADFQAQVVELARIYGWKCCHVRRSIGKGRRWTTATTVVGWPDLTLYHPDLGRFLMRELKTDKGEPSAQQLTVLADLQASGVDAGMWRPADWDEIQATLTAHRRSTTP